MRLPFGIELTRHRGEDTNVGTPVEAAAVNKQQTASPQRREVGDTGTDILSGIITEEYNSELQGKQGIRIFDEMRKSDGTVRASLLAVKLPIRRANWFVQPGSEDEADEEIREFVEKALFEWQRLTFDDFIRQALLSLDFGVMVFEKVFEIREWNGQPRIVWKKFAPRMPKSIEYWQTADEKPGIQQTLPDGGQPSIPIEKLLIFINEMEGDNWWGTSMLRSAYKHWFIKNNFYRIDNIAFERQGIGVPKAKLSEGASDDDWTRAEKILKHMRAHEQAYVIEPDGVEIEYMDMKSNSTRDPKESIQHHNREIVKGVLAQFLELGATDSGSRALSEDQTDLFLQSVEAIANNFIDVVNKYAIPQLVDLNFSGVENYPQLTYNNISKTDIEQIASAYETLTRAGGVTPGEGDEQYFRELLSLPEREDENEPEQAEPDDREDQEENLASELGLTDKKKVGNDPQAIEVSIQKTVAGLHKSKRISWIRARMSEAAKAKDPALRQAHDALRKRLHAEQARRFQETGEFKSWRPLTFAEKKVNFGKMQQEMDKLTKEVDNELRAILEKERRDFMKTLSKAVQDEDLERVNKTAMRAKTKYKQAIKDAMHKSYQFGKGSAAGEMNVDVPGTPKEMQRNIDIAAEAIATRHLAELTNEAKMRTAEALARGESKAETLGSVEKRLKKKADRMIADTADIAVAGFINNGRRTVFEENDGDIYALQRSEILDSRTCNYCLSVDGRIVEMDDPFANNTIFHANCRGIWVEILQDEEQKPDVTGVPQDLRDRFGDATNDLVQPRKPNVRKNSPAGKFLKKKDRDSE